LSAAALSWAKARPPVWFAFNEERPLAFFAGIWTRWTSVRKVKEAMVQVHHYKVPDVNTGDWTVPPLKSTAERIARISGEIIPSTMEMVALSSLDSEGRYDPKKSRKDT